MGFAALYPSYDSAPTLTFAGRTKYRPHFGQR
jgi:hypothetical protein